MKDLKNKIYLDSAKKAIEKANTQNEISNDVSNELKKTNKELEKAIVKKETFEKFNLNKKTSLDDFIDEKQDYLNDLRESTKSNNIQTLSLLEIAKLAISKLRKYNVIEAEKLENAISIKIKNINIIHNKKLRN
ncbi:hypothetical protein ACXHQL_21315 [Vibrio parahaemolyticus]|uniref:hypothetical protein n=1 Tax=Vibrio harveyi group TaxID=717610 RepID=UPI000420C255|nr:MULTISPECIES: hypothetical protein [Vibrio harveyi group]MCC3797891.1 hypothetical protein [Vibrio parahaemolyticus]MCC3812744.1 hypothetical protein [Vibrio parahaemolyticus]